MTTTLTKDEFKKEMKERLINSLDFAPLSEELKQIIVKSDAINAKLEGLYPQYVGFNEKENSRTLNNDSLTMFLMDLEDKNPFSEVPLLKFN